MLLKPLECPGCFPAPRGPEIRYTWPIATSSKFENHSHYVPPSLPCLFPVEVWCRLQWKDTEPLDGAGQVHLLGKGSKARAVRISTTTLERFESLCRGAPEDRL